jgi:DNA-binding CsgD family transcriptional regulator
MTQIRGSGTAEAYGLPEPAAGLLDALSSGILQTLELLQMPAFLVDVDARIRWQNRAAIELVGDQRGRFGTTFVAPEDLGRIREAFARKKLGALHTEYEVTMMAADRTRVPVAVSSVALKSSDGRMIGVFALARVAGERVESADDTPQLTPRQQQTLTLLAAGCSTAQMAELMNLAEETVRNHVKSLLLRLRAHSRVEAVARGRKAGLI